MQRIIPSKLYVKGVDYERLKPAHQDSVEQTTPFPGLVFDRVTQI